MVIADFKPGQTAVKVLTGVWQRDYGQVLRITGLSLPTAVEVHFAKENATEAIPMDGTTVDGVTDVWIPDELLNGSEMWNYHIYAYIYLTDDTSGQTEYVVDMLVKTRAKTGTDNPTETEQSLFTETVNAVNAAADRAEAAAKSAESANITVDSELNETSTNPIQNAVVAKKIGQLTEQIKNLPSGGTGAGWTTEQINLLDSIGNFIPFTSADGGTLWDNLITSLRSGSGEEEPDTPIEPDEPEATLTAISATYSGGEAVVGTALTDLTGIVVTAVYSDGTTKTVTDYTLSGEIVEGTNTITVSYSGKTATFTVTGVAESSGDTENNGWENGVPYTIEWTDGYLIDNSTGEPTENTGMSVSDFLPCAGVSAILGDTNTAGRSGFYWAYDADKNYLGRTLFEKTYPNAIPSQVKYLRASKGVSATTGISLTPMKYDELTESTVWESGKYYEIGHKLGGINGTTGAETESSTYFVSNYCLCYGATKMTVYPQNKSYARRLLAFYDGDKKLIGFGTGEGGNAGWDTILECEIPEGATYFRMSAQSQVLYGIVQPDKPIITLE